MIKMELTEKQKEIILPVLNRYYDEADNFMSTYRKLSADCWDYYNGDLPIIQNKDYVIPYTDRTCKTQVEGALKDLCEVFLSSDHEPVQFVPERADEDPALAVAATKLVRQVYNDNDGDMLFYNLFKESLITGTSFVKRYWDTKREIVQTQAKNLQSEEEAEGLILAWREGGLTIDEANILLEENEDGTFDLTVSYEAVFETCKMDFIPIEEILISQEAAKLQDATYFCHRVKKTKAELIDFGFDPEEISKLSVFEIDTTDYYNVNSARSHYRRFDDQDIGSTEEDLSALVWVKEHYPLTSLLEPEKTPQRYKILECAGMIKSCEVVSEIPVSVFSPTPIPNQVMSESLVEYTADIQDKLTWYQRDILKHMELVANPKLVATKGMIEKRSLQDPKPWTVIEIEPGGSLDYFPPPPMDQNINTLIGIAQNEAALRTGINDTQQGNVGNALETGRMAEGSVDKMLTLAASKVRNMARNLAYGGIQDLMKAVYRLVRENATQPISVLTAGGVIQIPPSQLVDRRFVRIDVALTSQEKAKKASALATLVQFAQTVDPNLEFIQPQNRAFMLYQMADALGFPNYHDFFMPIEAYQPPQPGIVDQLQVQKLQSDIGLTEAKAKSLLQEAQNATEKHVVEGQIAADNTKRADAELTFKMQKGADETQIENGKLEMERQRDILRYRQHQDKASIEQYRAQTDDLKTQSHIMLESRKLGMQMQQPQQQ